MKLFLFDLDGTLVSTGGAGLRALDKAFYDLFKIPGSMKNINPSGKTDPAIFREMIRLHLQRDMNSSDYDDLSTAYLAYLDKEMKVSHRKEVLAGVREFLDHLSEREDIVIALGTGNLEQGARIKLEPMNLNTYFSFGGFGSDAEDRSDVLQWGHRRANEVLGAPIDSSSVFVIGDTPLDVAAARRSGFQAVAVASGGFSLESLAASKPDFLWPDMRSGFEFLKIWER